MHAAGFIMLLSLSAAALPSAALWAQSDDAELTAKVGNFAAFFRDDKRLRHERWELSAKQTTAFGMHLKTVMEGRLWWDMALMGNRYAARRSYSEDVRRDEVFKGEARGVYLDYLGDSFRVKIGRQVIDWTGSPSPAIFDMLTPMDVRHGVAYAASDLIVPVNALDLTHDFIFDGSLEWLLIPEGEHHILPTGDNGYGYYGYMQSEVRPRPLVLVDEDIPRQQDEAEFGARYQATMAGFDLTLLGFRGHQRSPAYDVSATERVVTVRQYYPRVNTFGASLAYAEEAVVGRLLAFYEPKRTMRLLAASADFDDDEVYDRRYLTGLGLDWVIFDQHLKLYSEQLFSRLETVVPDHPTPAEDAVAGVEDGYVGMFKLTNETVDRLMISFEGIFSAPNRSRMLTPAVEYTFADNYTVAAGARFFQSEHGEARFEQLKGSSHYFARVETKIDVGRRMRSN